MDIWQFNRLVSRRLLAWNVVNILAGGLISRRKGFWQGFGSQNIGWGVINIGIAVGGHIAARRRYHKLDNPHDPAITGQDASNLRRLLLVNAGLDVLYMLGGLITAATRGRDNPRWRGIGWGIVVQGALLFVFDLFHAPRVPLNHDPADESVSVI